MSVYYNSVGEGWFKKVNNVVNESKYSVGDMNITYRKNEVNGMKKLEIEIDEMDENSKEVKDFLSKYLDKNDVYAAQDVIHDYIKGLKNKDVDEVYIAFESKDNVVSEEITNNEYLDKVNKYVKDIQNIILPYIHENNLNTLIRLMLSIKHINNIKDERQAKNVLKDNLKMFSILVDESMSLKHAADKDIDLYNKSGLVEFEE